AGERRARGIGARRERARGEGEREEERCRSGEGEGVSHGGWARGRRVGELECGWPNGKRRQGVFSLESVLRGAHPAGWLSYEALCRRALSREGAEREPGRRRDEDEADEL